MIEDPPPRTSGLMCEGDSLTDGRGREEDSRQLSIWLASQLRRGRWDRIFGCSAGKLWLKVYRCNKVREHAFLYANSTSSKNFLTFKNWDKTLNIVLRIILNQQKAYYLHNLSMIFRLFLLELSKHFALHLTYQNNVNIKQAYVYTPASTFLIS